MRFRVGEAVRIASEPDSNHNIGDVGIVTELHEPGGDFDYSVRVPSSREPDFDGSYKDGELEPAVEIRGNGVEKTNREDSMSIVTKIKKLTLSKGEKTLRQVGLKNDCGEWTSDAREVMLNILLDEREADMVAKAEEVIKEDKAEKK